MKFIILMLPYIGASLVEMYYKIPRAATWWIGGLICLSGLIGSYLTFAHYK